MIMTEYCEKVENEGLLIRLLDKELDSAEEEEVLAHLRTCPDCLTKMAQVFQTHDELKWIFSREAKTDQPPAEDSEQASPPGDAPGQAAGDLPNQGLHGIIGIDDLPVGTALEYSLYDRNGQLLVSSNTRLTKALVDGMRRRGIIEVTVKPVKAAPVSGYRREAKAFKGSPDREFYMAIANGGAPATISVVSKQIALDSLKRAFANVGPDSAIDIDDVRDTCEDVIDDIVGDEVISPSIIDMYLTNPSLYHHSINVMVTFAALCRALDLNMDRIKAYSVGAMLHDIGRVLLKKISEVRVHDRVDIYMLHPEAAFRYLRGLGGFEVPILNAVRNHHERIDGQGFPRGLAEKELDEYNQALILSNYYDNVTWDHSREVKTGFRRAANIIIQQGHKFVSKRVANAFLNVYGHHPPGSWVKLSSREAGMVVQARPFKPRSPLVHLYYDRDGDRLDEAIPVDLSEPYAPYITGRFDPF